MLLVSPFPCLTPGAGLDGAGVRGLPTSHLTTRRRSLPDPSGGALPNREEAMEISSIGNLFLTSPEFIASVTENA